MAFGLLGRSKENKWLSCELRQPLVGKITKNPRMSLRWESLSTEIFVIDMLYSLVDAVLGETLIKLAQRGDSVCVCVYVPISHTDC